MKRTFKVLLLTLVLIVGSFTQTSAEENSMEGNYDHFNYWVGSEYGYMEIKPLLEGLNPGGAASVYFKDEWASIDVGAYKVTIDGKDMTNNPSITLTDKGSGRYDFFINAYYETSIQVEFRLEANSKCGDMTTTFASKVTGSYDKDGKPVAQETKDVFNHTVLCEEDWGVEGGYPTDPDTGNAWEEEANKVPMTPLEPATPVEKPEEPKEEVPLIPLEPSEPVEKPAEKIPMTPIEPSTPVEKEEAPVEDSSSAEKDDKKDTVDNSKEEKVVKPEIEKALEEDAKTDVEQALSIFKEPSKTKVAAEVLPPTGLGNGMIMFAGVIILIGSTLLLLKNRKDN